MVAKIYSSRDTGTVQEMFRAISKQSFFGFALELSHHRPRALTIFQHTRRGKKK